MADQPARRLHDGGSGTVIDPQERPFGVRVILLESKHDLRPGAPEPVDGLVVVPHDKQVAAGGGQHFHDLVLHPVDVLELVDQDKGVSVLPGRQDVLPLGEQLVAHHQHVVKIQQALAGQPVLVALVQLLKQLLGTVL